MIKIVKDARMIRFRTIFKDGREIGMVTYDTKNHVCVYQGKIVVYSNNLGVERFHKLSSAIKFCQL